MLRRICMVACGVPYQLRILAEAIRRELPDIAVDVAMLENAEARLEQDDYNIVIIDGARYEEEANRIATAIVAGKFRQLGKWVWTGTGRSAAILIVVAHDQRYAMNWPTGASVVESTADIGWFLAWIRRRCPESAGVITESKRDHVT